MTTQIVKRTEGGVEMYETKNGHFALEGRTSDRRKVRVANCQNAANAEYIRRAWNMHEDAVELAVMIRRYHIGHGPSPTHVEILNAALAFLSQAQQ